MSVYHHNNGCSSMHKNNPNFTPLMLWGKVMEIISIMQDYGQNKNLSVKLSTPVHSYKIFHNKLLNDKKLMHKNVKRWVCQNDLGLLGLRIPNTSMLFLQVVSGCFMTAQYLGYCFRMLSSVTYILFLPSGGYYERAP